MDISTIKKAAGAMSGLELTAAEMEKINRHTLRDLSADEVFAFKVTLCDNEIDRDFERFSLKALHKLAGLFVGKTGIFDHNPTASGQTARIYHTEIVEDRSGKTKTGEAYTRLLAHAYMVRDEATASTIRNIEAGILKEVSIGCAIARTTCSFCGKNRKSENCGHQKGVQCHDVLDDPTDAYEWSFVAVPAQPAAGVTKSAGTGDAADLSAIRELLERGLTGMRDALDRLLAYLPEGQTGQNADEQKSVDMDPSVVALINDVDRVLKEYEGEQ